MRTMSAPETYQTSLQVRFGDVDAAGIAYYPRIYDMIHRAFENMWGDHVGIQYYDLVKRDGIGFPLAHSEVDFKSPLRFGDLRFAGKVGTGYDHDTLRSLRDRLDGIEREDSPFADQRGGADTHYVEPRLVAEVAFSEWTHLGRLRHPRYLGLRDDKDPDAVVREG